MGKILQISLLLLLGSSLQTYGQNGSYLQGGRSQGMGHASVTLNDGWSIFNNVGGIAGVDHTQILLGYQHRFGLEFLNTISAAVVSPLRIGAVGVSAFRFGDDLFNQQKIGLAYGNKFGLASLGVKANYLQYNIDGFGRRGMLMMEIGGVAEITEKIFFGAHITNFTQTKLAEFDDERVPTLLKAGLSYRPIKGLMVNIETEKDVELPATIRAGFEYEIQELVSIRSGFSTFPFNNYFGLGLRPGNFTFDYAFSNSSAIGNIHHLSIILGLGKKNKS
jgi:hypothetical protein